MSSSANRAETSLELRAHEVCSASSSLVHMVWKGLMIASLVARGSGEDLDPACVETQRFGGGLAANASAPEIRRPLMEDFLRGSP